MFSIFSERGPLSGAANAAKLTYAKLLTAAGCHHGKGTSSFHLEPLQETRASLAGGIKKLKPAEKEYGLATAQLHAHLHMYVFIFSVLICYVCVYDYYNT